MTDDFAIQQQRPSAVPYLLGGAAVGGAAGLGVNQWTNFAKGTPMTHEDVIKEMNDKDAFTKNTAADAPEAAGWKDVKAKADAVKTAETELETAQKGTLADTAKEAENLKNAQQARQAEFDRLLEAERKSHPAKGGVVTELPTPEEMRLGIKGDDASKVAKDFNYYSTKLAPDYNTARDAVIKDTTTVGHAQYEKAKTGKDAYRNKVEQYYTDLSKLAGEKDPRAKKLAERNLDKSLDRIVRIEYPDPTKTEIMKKAFEDGQMVPNTGVFSSVTADYTDPKTSKTYVLKDGVKYKDLQRTAKAEVDAQRASLASEIAATNEEYVTAQQNLNKFEGKTEFRKTGKKGGPNRSYVCELSDVQGKDAVKTYTEQKRVLAKALDGKKLTKSESAILNNMETAYALKPTDVVQSKQLMSQLESRIALAEEYATLSGAKEAAIGGQSRIALYDNQMEEAIKSNPQVKSAIGKIKKLAQKYGINVESAPATDESALKQIVENKLKGSTFEQEIANCQKAYDEALKKGGVVDEEAVKAAKSKLETAKGDLEKAAKSLGEKCSKGGKAKWIAPAIGAAAAAIAALAIRPSSKDA